MVQILQTNLVNNNPYFATRLDCRGNRGISTNCKILVSLKILAYGTAFISFMDYFQMSESSIRDCFLQFIKTISTCQDPALSCFLRNMTKEDVDQNCQLHLEEHGVPGMIGSLD